MTGKIYRHRMASAALCVLLAVLMLLSTAVLPPTRQDAASYAATTFKDTAGHWAQRMGYIEKAVNYGIVNGYTDGTFKPDNPISRAEFTKMLNAALGNNSTTDLGFWDILDTDWYYNDIKKGVAAGFITGRSETVFAPEDKINRQEAAVMLARVVPASGSNVTLKVYDDYSDVEKWATVSMEKMAGKGYIQGFTDGKLYPTANLTRAQAAKILTEIIDKENIDANNKRVVDHDGPSLTLENMIYSNRMTIDASVSDKLITFKNCVILGSLVVEGGSSGTNGGVQLQDTRVSALNVSTGDSEVRVYAKGESTIKNTVVEDMATLETGTLSGSGDFGQGFAKVEIGRAADVSLIGDFADVTIAGAKVDLAVSEGTVQNLVIEKAATKTNVDIAADGTIYNVEAHAEETVFSGKGAITKLNAHADGITYETEPARIETDSSVNVAPALAVDAERSLTITPVPADGATGVPVSEDIVLKFSSVVHLSDFTGSQRLTDSQAESVISLRKGSTGGTSVPFTADVADDGKSVSLRPDAALEINTTYYLKIAADELTDEYGHENDLFTSSFTTGLASYEVQFEPSTGSTEVSLTAIPTITFGDPVKRYSSGSTSLTDQYLHDTVISFQKLGPNQVNRSNVAFTASIDSSNRQITINPTGSLEEESTYYITINANTLMTSSDGQAVKERTSSFTTVSNSLTNRITEATDYDEAKITFKSLQKGTVYGIIFKQSELESQPPTADKIRDHSYIASVSANPGHYNSVKVSKNETATLNFSGLEANTAYYVYVVLYEDEKTPGSVFAEPVSTAQKLATLSSLNIQAQTYQNGMEADNTERDILKGSDGASSLTYYIGPSETTLKVTPEKTAGQEGTISYEITFDPNISMTSVDQATQPVSVVIPAASDTLTTTDIGTLKVDVKSSNSSYGTKTYTVKIRRIIPTVKQVSVTGRSSYISDIFTDEEEVKKDSLMATSINLSSQASTDSITLTPYIQSSASVDYRIEQYKNGAWTAVGTDAYTSGGTARTLGTKAELLSQCSNDASILYRISTRYYLYGTSDRTGTEKNKDVYYVKLRFTDAE